MKLKNTIIAALVVAIVAAGVLTAAASNRWHGHQRGCGLTGLRTCMELNLSDSQRDEMNKIITKYKEQMNTIRGKMFEARGELSNIICADEYKEENIRKVCKDILPVFEEKVLLRAKFFVELKALLSPEQLKMLQDRNVEKKKMLRGRKQFRRPMFDCLF